jgi:hypothetical protein
MVRHNVARAETPASWYATEILENGLPRLLVNATVFAVRLLG